ncbi:MAG: hypothetical protein H6839_13205 [Planctomycetes bacterium]|nr:hypothetical protein [Planctomycetota bacterium]
MDEQTFRRLAPDAVAGRLDTATYERWKAATGENPERASFVVRVAEADAKVSGIYEAIKPVQAREPSRRVPKRTAVVMALAISLLGLLAGALAMHSYIRSQKRIDDNKAALLPPANETKAPDNTPVETPPENTPLDNSPPPTNTPDDPPIKTDPVPNSDPPKAMDGFRLLDGATGLVSVRGEKDDRWQRLEPGQVLKDGDSVSFNETGVARFTAPGLSLSMQQPAQFEYRDGVVRFTNGRVVVRATTDWNFSCYKTTWGSLGGAFIVEPRKLGGELFLLEGGVIVGNSVYTDALQITLDGSGNYHELTPEQIRTLESELLGPHSMLLRWDGEAKETTPAYCALIEPGALGDGHALTRKPGDPGIGVTPSTAVFTAESNARLRMRVKTNAARLRIEFRVHLESGFRVVDALVDVPPAESWTVVDVPLEALRAGRSRDEPGWLPGREYSAFLVVPAADPAEPLARHELQIDDLLVYAAD